MLVVGSSLTVWSSFRLIKQALGDLTSSSQSVTSHPRNSHLSLPKVLIINDGPTRADSYLQHHIFSPLITKLEARASDLLPAVFG